jgi:hypothetical protein
LASFEKITPSVLTITNTQVMMLNGAITSLILSDLLPVQAVEHIIMMAIQGFGTCLGWAVRANYCPVANLVHTEAVTSDLAGRP